MSKLGLPLEFKLYMKGKHVGYEEHFFNYDEDIQQIEIFHEDLKGKTGRITYGFYIEHDEKRQITGFKDKRGEKISFGDKLIFSTKPDKKSTVIFDNNSIVAKNDENNYLYDVNGKQFNEMELV